MDKRKQGERRGCLVLSGVLMALTSLSPLDATVMSPSGDEGRQRLLSTHNALRSDVGVPPLRWNEDLARGAAEWAEYLARTSRFEHSRQDYGDATGENLWMGTRGYYRIEDMVGMWSEERRLFRQDRFPDNSRSGSWSDVGHYTQMIWRETREIGCAMARNVQDEFLVCRYYPAGNVMGQFPF